MECPRVRFHADDLGIHPLIDSAIFEAYEAGALAGASVLVNGATFPQAASRARALDMPVALHLNLVDGIPLSPTQEVPSLVGRDGQFRSSYQHVVVRGLIGNLQVRELRLEARRQLELFTQSNLASHGLELDGHQHLHLLPAISRVILELAAEFRIRRIRIPRRSPIERRERSVRSVQFAGLEWLGQRVARRFAGRDIQPVACWGVLYAGHLTEPRVQSVLRSLPAGATGQVLCHPGSDNARLSAVFPWHYDWQGDLRTVLTLGPDLG